MFKHRAWDFHSGSQLAHIAACEANAEGKFWPFALGIYRDIDEVSQPALEKLAANVGVDVVKLRQAIATQPCEPRIREDIALADRLGINATPTLFINGRRVVGDESLEFFEHAIDQELAAAASAPGAQAAPAPH